MPTKLEQVRSLIALAGNESTPTEEARSAAHTAARVIMREGFEISEKRSAVSKFLDDLSSVEAAPRRRWPEAGPSPRGVSREKKQQAQGDVVITAKSAGFCAECGDAYPKGARVVWQGKDRRIVHRECHSARRGVPSDLG